MTIYATAKWNKDLKLFQILEYYLVWGHANSDICKGTIAVKSGGRIYYQADYPSGQQHHWSGLLRKKDLSKKYIKPNGDVYIIKEIKVNG